MIDAISLETAHLLGDALPSAHRLRHRIFVERQKYDVPRRRGMEWDSSIRPPRSTSCGATRWRTCGLDRQTEPDVAARWSACRNWAKGECVERIPEADRRSLTVPSVATGRRRSNDARRGPQSPTPAEIDGLTCFRRRATPNGNAACGDTRGPRRHKPRLTLRLNCAIFVPKRVNKPVERRGESEKGGCYESSRCRSSLGCPAVVLLDRCERQVR